MGCNSSKMDQLPNDSMHHIKLNKKGRSVDDYKPAKIPLIDTQKADDDSYMPSGRKPLILVPKQVASAGQ